MAQEVWGHSNEAYSFHPDGVVNTDHDDTTHPDLNGLWHAHMKWHTVWSPHGDFDLPGDIHTYHHLDGRRHWNEEHADRGAPHHQEALWDSIQHESNIKTVKLKSHISEKTRSLIHNHLIAADQIETEGHEKLAHSLRNATLVHTYHGSDDAFHPDVAFVHNNKFHILVREPGGRKRYHFTTDVR